MKLDWEQLEGLRVTVMGLGLHGGGVATAAFFANHGARVTVTDLRSEADLAASLVRLSAYPIRYVLGRHELDDFESADIVVKNPAVSLASPYLRAARRLESDISVFLSLVANPLIAVTGTKGKSTTASAIHFVLKSVEPEAKIGGNITVSPLTFVDDLRRLGSRVPVVLELSSWQLADLRDKEVLRARVALVTNILPDHQNRYSSMEDYVSDKAVIVQGQTPGDFTLGNYGDPYTVRFTERTSAQVRYFSPRRLPNDVDGAWLEAESERGVVRNGERLDEIMSGPLLLPGAHNRMNLLAAGLALHCSGISPATIRTELSRFPGLPHRLEFVAQVAGRRYFNDSAATIPEATVAALGSFSDPVVLIAGGTDKSLDFSPFAGFSRTPKCVILLAGSAVPKIVSVLSANGISYRGPFESIDRAVCAAVEASSSGDIVLLSPGCASFEMFANEFDRGESYVRVVRRLETGGEAENACQSELRSRR